MQINYFKLAAAVGVSSALLASSAGADTLRMAYSAAPSTVDPFKSSASPTASLNEHIYEALVSRTDQPLLATSYEWQDNTTLLFHLREGVTFHNGAAFTAQDVVYSACRMMYRVDGKKNMLTSAMSPVTDVKVIDDHTVAFTTLKAYPVLPEKLKSLSILSASQADFTAPLQYDNTGDCGITRYPARAQFESGEMANGTGKYTLESFANTGDADLVRNPNHWSGGGNWDRVEIRSVKNSGARMAGLLAGDFNLVENPTMEDLESLKDDAAYSSTSTPSWRTIFLILDVGSEQAPGVTAADGSNPLADLRVRKALSLAVNREAIVDRLMGGMATVASQFSPSYREGADPTMPDLTYDPEQAKALLAEAGYATGIKMELNVPNDRYINGTRVAQAIAQYFTRVGIEVSLKAEPWSVFKKGRKNRDFGVFMYGWGHPQGAAQMISYAFASRNKDLNLGVSNYSNYHNADFDAAMEKWAVETDKQASHGYLQAAMQVAVNELPGIPLYYQHSIWAHDSNLTVVGRPDERTFADMASPK